MGLLAIQSWFQIWKSAELEAADCMCACKLLAFDAALLKRRIHPLCAYIH